MTSKIKIIRAIDPRIAIDEPQSVVAPLGPIAQTFTTVQPSAKSFSPTYTIQCPSQGMGINRLMYQRVTGTVTLTGTNMGAFTAESCIAMRSWPLARCMSSLRATINNCSVSINPNLYMSALAFVGNDSYEQYGVQSGTSTSPDMLTTPFDNLSWQSSPFGNPLHSPQSDHISSSRTQQITGIVATATTLDISYDIIEPLVISPFVYNSQDNQKSFFGVNNLVIDISYVNSMCQLLDYSIPIGSTVTSSVNLLGTMTLLVTYVAPSDLSLLAIPRAISYNYTNLQQFPTTIPILPASTIVGGVYTLGAGDQVTSNACQLSTIPRAFLVFCSPSQTDLNSVSKEFNTCSTAIPKASGTQQDVFFQLSNINVQFGNYSGIFSSAKPMQNWQVSARNGIDASYPRWAGLPIIDSMGLHGIYAGAPLLIVTSRDLQLPQELTSGMQVMTQFQISATVTNQTLDEYTNAQLTVVAITDGFFEIEAGASTSYLGGITLEELKKANDATPTQMAQIDLRTQKRGYSGGKYSWGNFKHDMRGVLDYIAPVSKPILGALTNRAVKEIGAGGAKASRGHVRHALDHYY